MVAAFLDIQPINPGHVLVIPVQHSPYLEDLAPETGANIFKVAQLIAKAIRRSSVKSEGVNLFLADGAAAGQEVFHSHLHVFPRFDGDGFGLNLSEKYFQKPSRKDLDEFALKIRRNL